MGRTWAGAIVAAMLVAAVPARADTSTNELTVLRGSLAAGREPSTLIVTTDASDTRFYLGGRFRHHSVARFAWRKTVRAPFEVSFEWQFLTPGRWSLDVEGLGVTAIIGTDRLGFFVDDAQMMGTMFAELPGVGGPGRRTITIRRTPDEIVLVVDGKEVGRKAVVAPAAGKIVIGLRGAPGHRSRGEIRELTLRSLATEK
jgi:hypothetical protein